MERFIDLIQRHYAAQATQSVAAPGRTRLQLFYLH